MMITRSNAEALMDDQVVREIMEGVTAESQVLKLFRRLPNMTSGQTKLRVLDALPVAYWVDEETNNGRKKTTEAAWANKFITAEELAVIVPVKENTIADADIDIWAEVKPRLVEAFATKIDGAIIAGVDKPKGFRADLVTSILNAGATVDVGGRSLYELINDAMTKVEESGYMPTGCLGGIGVKGQFRMMVDKNGQPIKGTEIDNLPKNYVTNGAWDKNKSQLIIGDFRQAVYAIRQDVTYKILDQAVIQDPSTKEILYNLAQDDMVALRVTMRLGWEIPNPVNAQNPGESRFPFASINPARGEPATQTVTFTVASDTGSTKVKDAKITFGGVTKKTNASGVATFKAAAGLWPFTVEKDGVPDRMGTVQVVSSAVNAAINDFKPAAPITA